MPTTIGSIARPGLGRATALDHLEVDRQEDDRAEHREADDEAEGVASEKIEFLNSRSGMIGSLARDSMNTNSDREHEAGDQQREACGSPQPWSGPAQVV